MSQPSFYEEMENLAPAIDPPPVALLPLTPATPPEPPDVTYKGVPIVYIPNLGQQEEMPPVPIQEPVVELDLSQINAQDPEPEPVISPEQELDALVPVSFPPPPTEIP